MATEGRAWALRAGTGPKGPGLDPRARARAQDPCRHRRKGCAKLAPAAPVSCGERQLCAALAPALAFILNPKTYFLVFVHFQTIFAHVQVDDVHVQVQIDDVYVHVHVDDVHLGSSI